MFPYFGYIKRISDITFVPSALGQKPTVVTLPKIAREVQRAAVTHTMMATINEIFTFQDSQQPRRNS